MKILYKNDLSALLHNLSDKGYTIIGPRLRDEAIVFDEIKGTEDLPAGWGDEQDAGKYRIKKRKDNSMFAHTTAVHSWKKYLFPPRLKVLDAQRKGRSFKINSQNGKSPKYAFVGVRSCDLNALLVQDKVFLNGSYVDSYYKKVRSEAVIIAVNCTHASKTCFCVSMKTGPRVKNNYDIALTEITDEKEHFFTLETGSSKGEELVSNLNLKEAGQSEKNRAEKAIQDTLTKITKQLDTKDIKELFYNNPEHAIWNEVAGRCLTCANCTMVCPTCFCSTVEDLTDLSGNHTERWRRWDSCFSLDYSKVAGGNFRTSARARYRQWITHKLASWIDQFGTSGCVGCGRCISWCPVGIDITEEVKKLRITKKT